jgi:type I restriction enzyme S subunit
MSEWYESTIGGLGRVITGKTPPAAHPQAFGVKHPFVTPTDMVGQRFMTTTDRCLSAEGAQLLRRLRVPTGALMVSCIGWQLGKVAISTADSFTNQQINTIIPDRSKVDPVFLYYHLRTRRDELKRLASGGTRTPILNKSRFEALQVRLPPRHHQELIVAILGSIDDLIENNQRRVWVLEQMSRAIYREWFVKFRYPGHQDLPLIDSTIGPIPEGWRIATVGDILELKYGKALTANDRRGGSVPVVSSAGIIGRHDEALVDGPAIVVGRKGNVGSIHWVDDPCWPIDTAYYVDTRLPLRFVAEQLRRTEFTNTHAAVPGLSREGAYARPFVLPPIALIEAFQDLVEPFGAQATTLVHQGETLAQIRDLLLPKLVTGRIDVSTLDLDAVLEGAVA